MPEPRFDPLGRRWVLLAPERARRGVPPTPSEEPDPAPCDFCGGREDHTPAETYAIRPAGGAADTQGWRVRVVPNLYPATAVHEVVVHSPDHHARLEALSAEHRLDVLRAYRDRVAAAAGRTKAVVAAVNRGRRAGASRSHDHGQLFGLSIVPPTLAREAEALAEGPCVLCRLAADADLLVERAGDARILVHPAPLVAGELLIVGPCAVRFDEAGDTLLDETAEAFAVALRKIHGLYGPGAPLNLVLHTAPVGAERFHWHAHLYPRTATWGALELGAELPIVADDPAETVVGLRQA